MTPERAEAALRGCTAVARKVYEAVPAAEQWDPVQIRQNLLRMGHSSIDTHIMRGCLGALRDHGLVVEREGRYIRTKVKAKPVQQAQEEPETMTEPKKTDRAKPTAGAALESLSAIATKLSAAANDLLKIASELEFEALRIATELDAQDEDSAKLDQLRDGLRAVLKGIA